jgi:hypothetical protein
MDDPSRDGAVGAPGNLAQAAQNDAPILLAV